MLGPFHPGMEQVFLGAEVVELLEKGCQVAAIDIEVISDGRDGQTIQIVVFFDDVSAFQANLLSLTQLLNRLIGTEATDFKEKGIGQA